MNNTGIYKRRVEEETFLNIEPLDIWEIVENVATYPKYVKFMHKAKISGPFEAGSSWTDLSTVLVFPLLVKHKITKVEEGKRAVFLIKMPFGGRIIQEIGLEPIKNGTKIRISADINLGNKLMDILLSGFFKRRTRVMLVRTLENFNKLAKEA